MPSTPVRNPTGRHDWMSASGSARLAQARIVSGSDRLWGVLAALSLLAAPQAGYAQSRNADQALEDLIPDSALDNPKGWALDTDAARMPTPAIDELLTTEPLKPLTGMPEINLAWPDEATTPVIEPLSPDADIAVAREEAAKAGEALGDEGNGTAGAQIANASISHVGPQIDLAFPPDVDLPERDAIVARFAGLSSLRTLDRKDDNLAQLSRRGKSDIDLIQRILRLYGFYDAQVIQSLTGLDNRVAAEDGRTRLDAEKVVFRFDITPGPQYLLARIDLGDVDKAGADSGKLRAAFGLKTGDPVNTDRIVVGKAALSTELGETGRAFAQVGDPDLVIDHEPRTGDLTVPVTTGGIYTFGRVSSSLPDYLSSRHLERIARFEPGDLYKRSLVDDLRKAILATGLVSSVTVDAREAAKPAADKPGTVDLDVTLAKAPQRTIAGLIGYSSGEGVRLEGSWEHRNFFPPEGLLRVRGVVGTREQLAGVTFRRNNFLDRDQVVTADLYAQTKDTDAYNARTISAIATIEKQTTLIFQKPWVYSGGLEIVATSELAAGQPAGTARTTYFIGAIPLHGAYDGSDDLLDPHSGFRASLRVSPEISVHDGERANYVKAQADISGYLPVSSGVVLAARTRVGTISGAPVDAIAPSRRFYAGGGASVRGYAYQAVGPKDSAGNPSGGRSLTEFSLEARVKTGLVGGAISVVPFIDAGTVGTSSSPTLSGLQVGAGIGIRYQTNFGPIRVDVGTPLNRRAGDSRIGVYVALGQAF